MGNRTKLVSKEEALKLINRHIKKEAAVLFELLTWRNKLQRAIRKEKATK